MPKSNWCLPKSSAMAAPLKSLTARHVFRPTKSLPVRQARLGESNYDLFENNCDHLWFGVAPMNPTAPNRDNGNDRAAIRCGRHQARVKTIPGQAICDCFHPVGQPSNWLREQPALQSWVTQRRLLPNWWQCRLAKPGMPHGGSGCRRAPPLPRSQDLAIGGPLGGALPAWEYGWQDNSLPIRPSFKQKGFFVTSLLRRHDAPRLRRSVCPRRMPPDECPRQSRECPSSGTDAATVVSSSQAAIMELGQFDRLFRDCKRTQKPDAMLL